MGNPFLERIRNEVLVGDGAIGTMLYAKGVALEANFEHLNLVRPELVLAPSSLSAWIFSHGNSPLRSKRSALGLIRPAAKRRT
jgi:hypothetical protein